MYILSFPVLFVLTTYQPHIPTTYQPPTDHIPTTYRPHTDRSTCSLLLCYSHLHLLQAACWSPDGCLMLFAVAAEPALYSLQFHGAGVDKAYPIEDKSFSSVRHEMQPVLQCWKRFHELTVSGFYWGQIYFIGEKLCCFTFQWLEWGINDHSQYLVLQYFLSILLP